MPTRYPAATSSETPTGRSLHLYSRENEAGARQAKMLTKDEAEIAVARLGDSRSVLVSHAYPVGPSPHDDAMPDGVVEVQVEFHWQIGSILQP
jgi:hypothetical protein